MERRMNGKKQNIYKIYVKQWKKKERKNIHNKIIKAKQKNIFKNNREREKIRQQISKILKRK